MPFQPGQSGNPAGRVRGSRNKRTILFERLLEEHMRELAEAAVRDAIGGDPAALRACLDRLAPPGHHRPIDFEMPKLETAADAAVASNAIAQGLAHDELTARGAAGLIQAVRIFVRATAAADRDKQIAARLADDGASRAGDEKRDADDDAVDLSGMPWNR